jgi:BASS family bile acid:Na+ symporter
LTELFKQHEGTLAASQLVLAMLGMGATLRPADFREIRSRPQTLVIVLVAQYLLFPLMALLFAQVFSLPNGIALGLLVLAVMPSGAMSNLITHLGLGNVALSIASTLASMLTCLLVTPLLLQWFGSSTLPADFRMPTGEVIDGILLFLLLPLGGGMLVRKRFPRIWVPFSRWMVRASVLVLATIVVGSLGTGRIEILGYGLMTPIVLIVFCIVQFELTRQFTAQMRYPPSESYTLAIEVAFRNGNLAILLSTTMYYVDSPSAHEMGAGTLYVALFYGGASLILALMSIVYRRRRPVPRE